MIDYDAHEWRETLFEVHGSMLREIGARVAVCVAWSIGVVAVHLHVRKVDMPPTVHTLVGVALGLLLVFRTNASYDRFWEGRKMWGGIVNETRNLVRATRVLLDKDLDLHAVLARWTAAWCYSTMENLRGGRSVGPERLALPARDLDAALAAQHIPLHIAVRMSTLLQQARERGLISDFQQMTLDQNVQLLIDYMGACERIHKTPLPFAYVVHLRRALILYCFALPFVLVETFGWGAVAGTMFVAYVFFGIEEIGVEIEDPFGTDDNDLPLERICETIERNLMALTKDAPPTALPVPVLSAPPV